MQIVLKMSGETTDQTAHNSRVEKINNSRNSLALILRRCRLAAFHKDLFGVFSKLFICLMMIILEVSSTPYRGTQQWS